MTQPNPPLQTVVAPHEPTPGPCDNSECAGGNHVCTTCGGGVDAYVHLPEARGEGPTASVEAGAVQTVAVEHSDTAAGGEATK